MSEVRLVLLCTIYSYNSSMSVGIKLAALTLWNTPEPDKKLSK